MAARGLRQTCLIVVAAVVVGCSPHNMESAADVLERQVAGPLREAEIDRLETRFCHVPLEEDRWDLRWEATVDASPDETRTILSDMEVQSAADGTWVVGDAKRSAGWRGELSPMGAEQSRLELQNPDVHVSGSTAHAGWAQLCADEGSTGQD